VDRELLERAARGDRGAFSKLVEHHQRMVYSIALSVLHDADLAWDAAQETFLKLHARIASFRGDAPLRTFVSRIALHVAVDLRRRGQRSPERPVEGLALSHLPDPRGLADDEVERRELRDHLARAFASLQETQRTALVLREVEGQSYAQIARAMGVPVGTVMSRLFYARRALRALLAGPGLIDPSRAAA
jgi:RNA polymerase sigma-70 factor (ECF subfamily)